jgi:hypothetical protein
MDRKIYFAGNCRQLREWITFLTLRYGPDACLSDLPFAECR